MRRRDFIAGLSGAVGAAWPGLTPAQQKTIYRLGILLVGNREPFWRLLGEGLKELGYVEGQNLEVEFRSAEGKLNLLPELAMDLVLRRVDVIVASETPAVHAAKRATGEIPIVMAPSGDPVGTGLVASLARPGGNVTGLSAATAELAGKSLELVREIMPNVSRVAALADPTNSFTKPFLEQINLAATSIGLPVEVVRVRSPTEFSAAFEDMKHKGIEAVIVQPTLPRQPIIDLLRTYRIAGVSGNRAFADSGGLMSYSGSLADRYSKAAPYVDKILKGAKPSELPVQQPTKFELVINLNTAKALGLTVPSTLLARADEVIE
jgi:putative ABC transport system substrate-binding protein